MRCVHTELILYSDILTNAGTELPIQSCMIVVPETNRKKLHVHVCTGVRRQRIEFMLPVDSEGGNLTLRQDFQTVRNLTEALLVKLKQTSEFSVGFQVFF